MRSFLVALLLVHLVPRSEAQCSSLPVIPNAGPGNCVTGGSSAPTTKIGPSSMEGALAFPPGSWVSGGYHFSGGTPGTQVTFVGAQLALPVTCVKGSSLVAGTII